MGNDELLPRPSAWPRFSNGDDLSGQDHDRLFLPDARGKFHDVWPLLGLDRGTVSRGIATGDVFGDGRLAVAIARQWAPSLFLRNTSNEAGRAIVIDLRVPGAVARTVARRRAPQPRRARGAVGRRRGPFYGTGGFVEGISLIPSMY